MTSEQTTLLDISTAIETWAPLETAEPWDNCGIQLGDRGASISSILLSLDIDHHVLTYLKSNTPDLIITHHPLFFKSLKHVYTHTYTYTYGGGSSTYISSHETTR